MISSSRSHSEHHSLRWAGIASLRACAKTLVLVFAGSGALLLPAREARAADLAATPPGLVNYQGVLRSAAGAPLTGTYDMIFRFTDAPSGGTLLLTDLHTGPDSVAVSRGLFSTILGSGTISPGTQPTLADVFSNSGTVWLEIQVGAETLTPRVRVVSAAYAVNTARLGGLPASSFVDTTATAQIKSGLLTSTTGLVGTAAGATDGVAGATVSGAGVRGTASAGSGTTYGVAGTSASTTGTGVYGEATATSGAAYGVYGKTASGSGLGVLGSNLSAGNTEGVRGQTTSTTGKGVVGGAFATSGDARGVYGESQSTAGTGVYGRATTATGSTTGVGGDCFSTLGTGVAGVANATSGDAWGVYGATLSAAGFGVIADGDLGAAGNLFVTGSKSFITEHPTMADKMIRYNCIEGPDVDVFERGTARLTNGEAVVTTRETFPLVASGAVTVHLTPLDDCGGLYVVRDSVSPNGFTVRELNGGHSDAGFSYLVMAPRRGFENQETVETVGLGRKILLSPKLNPMQKGMLRAALGRVDQAGLAGEPAAKLYAAVHEGNFAEACRLLGGCVDQQGLGMPAAVLEPK